LKRYLWYWQINPELRQKNGGCLPSGLANVVKMSVQVMGRPGGCAKLLRL